MLFSMGGLFSIYEGWHKLEATEPVQSAWVAIAILAFGIAAESVSLGGLPARSQQGARPARPVALVPQLAPERFP